MCTITGNITDIVGGQQNTQITVQLSAMVVKYTDDPVTNRHIVFGSPKVIDVVTGVFEVDLQDTENMEGTVYYIFNINGILFKRYVPDASSADFWALTEPV